MGYLQGREKDAKASRAAVLQKADIEPPMPEVDHPVMETLAEMGWVEATPMGPAPLSAREILAWCEGMGDRPTPWEFSLIRRMSEAFCGGLQAERAPYQPTVMRMALATASFSAR